MKCCQYEWVHFDSLCYIFHLRSTEYGIELSGAAQRDKALPGFAVCIKQKNFSSGPWSRTRTLTQLVYNQENATQRQLTEGHGRLTEGSCSHSLRQQPWRESNVIMMGRLLACMTWIRHWAEGTLLWSNWPVTCSLGKRYALHASTCSVTECLVSTYCWRLQPHPGGRHTGTLWTDLTTCSVVIIFVEAFPTWQESC